MTPELISSGIAQPISIQFSVTRNQREEREWEHKPMRLSRISEEAKDQNCWLCMWVDLSHFASKNSIQEGRWLSQPFLESIIICCRFWYLTWARTSLILGRVYIIYMKTNMSIWRHFFPKLQFLLRIYILLICCFTASLSIRLRWAQCPQLGRCGENLPFLHWITCSSPGSFWNPCSLEIPFSKHQPLQVSADPQITM